MEKNLFLNADENHQWKRYYVVGMSVVSARNKTGKQQSTTMGPRYELKTIKQTKGKNGASGARFGFWFQMEKDLTSHDLVEAAKVDGVGK